MIKQKHIVKHCTNATHKHSILRLAWNGKTRKQFEELFAQSMWCLGQDILSPHGNLLVAYGLRKNKETDAPPKTASQYRQGPLTLWAFGIAWEELFVSRHRPRPSRLSTQLPENALWERSQLPATYWPDGDEARHMRTQLVQLCGWMAAYESWLAQHYPTQRQESLEQWNQRASVPSQDVIRVWDDLQRSIAQLPVR